MLKFALLSMPLVCGLDICRQMVNEAVRELDVKCKSDLQDRIDKTDPRTQYAVTILLLVSVLVNFFLYFPVYRFRQQTTRMVESNAAVFLQEAVLAEKQVVDIKLAAALTEAEAFENAFVKGVQADQPPIY